MLRGVYEYIQCHVVSSSRTQCVRWHAILIRHPGRGPARGTTRTACINRHHAGQTEASFTRQRLKNVFQSFSKRFCCLHENDNRVHWNTFFGAQWSRAKSWSGAGRRRHVLSTRLVLEKRFCRLHENETERKRLKNTLRPFFV